MAKRERINTPKGIFKFAHLNSPDYKGAERFGGDPMFRTSFVVERDAKGFDAFVAKLEKLHRQAYEAGEEKMDEANAKQKAAWKKKGITEPTLNDFMEDEVDEEGNPTGRVEFKFKTHATFTDRDTGKEKKKSVPFVDGRGQVIPWKKRPFVRGGTEGRVAFTVGNVFIPKDADVYLGFYLNQIQITKLAEAGGSAFGEDEDSDFSADELDEYEGNADDADDGDDLDGDDEDQNDGAGDDLDDDDIPF